MKFVYKQLVLGVMASSTLVAAVSPASAQTVNAAGIQTVYTPDSRPCAFVTLINNFTFALPQAASNYQERYALALVGGALRAQNAQAVVFTSGVVVPACAPFQVPDAFYLNFP
jgi:hypothetical protein